jgi:putative phosphoribosyl transferase
LICLATPDPFFAVGAHYANFEQTSDDEVRQLLRDRSLASAEAECSSGDKNAGTA